MRKGTDANGAAECDESQRCDAMVADGYSAVDGKHPYPQFQTQKLLN